MGPRLLNAVSMAKEFAKKFYKSKAWQRTREAYAASVGQLCEDCLDAGSGVRSLLNKMKLYERWRLWLHG